MKPWGFIGTSIVKKKIWWNLAVENINPKLKKIQLSVFALAMKLVIVPADLELPMYIASLWYICSSSYMCDVHHRKLLNVREVAKSESCWAHVQNFWTSKRLVNMLVWTKSDHIKGWWMLSHNISSRSIFFIFWDSYVFFPIWLHLLRQNVAAMIIKGMLLVLRFFSNEVTILYTIVISRWRDKDFRLATKHRQTNIIEVFINHAYHKPV